MDRKQRDALLKFYESCAAHGLDPEKNAVDGKRARVLLEKDETLKSLVEGKGSEEVAELFRSGRAFAEEDAWVIEVTEQAKKQSEDAKKRAQQQAEIDIPIHEAEQRIAAAQGKQKLLEVFEGSLARCRKAVSDTKRAVESYYSAMDGLLSVSQEKEKGWGTLGGIAAGASGSTLLGAAVSANIMKENAEIRERNAQTRKQIGKMMVKDTTNLYTRKINAEERLAALEKKKERLELLLSEDRPVEELMSELKLGKPYLAITEGDSVIVRVELTCSGREWKLTDDLPAVIDGCLIAELWEGDTKRGEAFLNLPLHGIERGESVLLYGLCPHVLPKTTYRLLIYPRALWLMEAFSLVPEPGTRKNGMAILTERDADVLDLCDLYYEKFSDLTYVKTNYIGISWKKRFREAEKERKLKEQKKEQERLKKEQEEQEKAAKKKKAIKILRFAVPAAVLLVVGGVLLNQNYFGPKRAYDAAKAQLAAGAYSEAAEAFAALGDFSDAKERVLDARYQEAAAEMERGSYESAANLFSDLGDYADAEKQRRAAQEQLLRQKVTTDYTEAISLFERFSADADADTKAFLSAPLYEKGVELFKEGADMYESCYVDSYKLLDAVRGYQDTDSLLADGHMLYRDQNKISFGQYEQDGNIANGAEPISWYILDRKGDQVFLLSEYCLDMQLFSADENTVLWDESYVRSWLNTDFMNAAFTAAEQTTIMETEHEIDRYEEAALYGAEDSSVTDKLFLLSTTEWNEFKEKIKWDESDDSYMLLPFTDYALELLESSDDPYSEYVYGSWMLRNTEEGILLPIMVQAGEVIAFDMGQINVPLGVRPAMWIRLSADVF